MLNGWLSVEIHYCARKITLTWTKPSCLLLHTIFVMLSPPRILELVVLDLHYISMPRMTIYEDVITNTSITTQFKLNNMNYTYKIDFLFRNDNFCCLCIAADSSSTYHINALNFLYDFLLSDFLTTSLAQHRN